MELSNLITEYLPESEFTIQRSNFGAKGQKIRINRDQDFRLIFEIEIRGNENIQSIKNFLNARRQYRFSATGINPNDRLLAKNLIIYQQTNLKDELFTIKGEFVNGSYYLASKRKFNPVFKDYYFLNNLGNLLFTRSTEFTSAENIQFTLEGFSSQTHSLRGPSNYHRNLLPLSYNSKSILIGSLDKDEEKNSLPKLFIRTRCCDQIKQTDIKKIQDYLTFIGSGRLIYIGSSISTENFTKIRNDYESTLSIGIANEIFRERFSPLILNKEVFIKEEIEERIQRGFDKFLEKHSEFAFEIVIGYLTAAYIAPFELKIQPLSAAYDLLKSCWFQSKFSKTNGKNLQDNDFLSIIEKYIPLIEAELDIKKTSTSHILKRLKRSNQMSLSEQNPIFFSELNLEIGEIEINALQRRHSVVHGNSKPIDKLKTYNANLAYFTIVNRVILRLLEFDEYRDYTYPSGHRQPKIESKMLGPNMNGKP